MSHRTRERPAECLASLSHSTMIGLPRSTRELVHSLQMYCKLFISGGKQSCEPPGMSSPVAAAHGLSHPQSNRRCVAGLVRRNRLSDGERSGLSGLPELSLTGRRATMITAQMKSSGIRFISNVDYWINIQVLMSSS
ncbi:hypothetical protein EVAR_40494_1 [Eumeta japonica]|uniref:Uncharacterized protein n=1 Tax=Eumeta variegata TaxID=151549 RepID=A0A4C1XX93_EUMVA|nr:hypothetical protein EVAR_40494_1 [Eumeta japonica]